MPKTCKGATVPDTAILHPILASRVTKIEVFKDNLFDSHQPVIFDLKIPWTQLTIPKIRFPETWVKLPIDADDLNKVVDNAVSYLGEPSDLTQWAELVECTVDMAIQAEAALSKNEGHLTKLPKKFRGRCTPKKIIQSPVITPCKIARQGDFQSRPRMLHFCQQKDCDPNPKVTVIATQNQKITKL